MNTACRQSGAVLVISLIILLILTLLGMSSIQTTTLEERMAGNTLSTTTALQAAEGSLRQGEGVILGWTAHPVASATGTGGLWVLDSPDPVTSSNTEPWWQEASTVANWWTNNGVSFVGTLQFASGAGPSVAPVHLIEEQAYIKDTKTIGLITDDTGRQFYQVTGRGVDISGTAEAILRSTFARRY
jgi:type IV pilus assembly protein PilX